MDTKAVKFFMGAGPRVFIFMMAGLWVWEGSTVSAGRLTPQQRCVISDFGAIGDGRTPNTLAIQSAIDHCATNGGGVVVVPPGIFLTGALFFKPGVNLLVEREAVLKGTTRAEDYPQVNTRWEGVERVWTCALLNFDNLTNVHVGGDGTIDGSGDGWMPRGGRRGQANPLAMQTNATTSVQEAAASGSAGEATNRSAANPGWRRGTGRPRLICFSHCRNVRITGLHLQRQAVWCLHLLYCQDVMVDGLNIRAMERIPSSDGIDVDSSRDVKISRCDIACNDDDIAIKCGKDADGRRVNQPAENITISDCVIGAGGGITMGSEVSGSIRHVLVERCRFRGTDNAARFKSQPSRGGVVEDITYRDIRLEDVRQAIVFDMAWRMVPPIAPPAKVLTLVRNVRFINLAGTAKFAGFIEGLKDAPIQAVGFRDCELTVERGLYLANETNTDLSGLALKVAEGEPIIRQAASTLNPGELTLH
jgi:polygalacturonase